MLYDPTGTWLIMVTGYGKLVVLDSSTCEVTARFRAHKGGISSATLSRDGTRLATASVDQTVRIWDTVPYRVRYEERQAIFAARPEAQRMVADLWNQSNDWKTVAARVRENPSLPEPVRHAALNEVLRRAMASREEALATPDESDAKAAP